MGKSLGSYLCVNVLFSCMEFDGGQEWWRMRSRLSGYWQVGKQKVRGSGKSSMECLRPGSECEGGVQGYSAVDEC